MYNDIKEILPSKSGEYLVVYSIKKHIENSIMYFCTDNLEFSDGEFNYSKGENYIINDIYGDRQLLAWKPIEEYTNLKK